MLYDLTNEIANVVVHIKSVKEITTKRNDRMAFVTIYDGCTTIEVTLFPEVDEVAEYLKTMLIKL